MEGKFLLFSAFCCLFCAGLSAQTFSLRQINDTCSVLVLATDSMSDEWLLPHPVYQFRTGDVDGDGVEEALVGVVKSTRFYPEKGNRLFVFKNRDGRVRPLWMGSRLGEELVDFCVADGKLLSIEKCRNGQYNLDESASNDAGTDNTTWTNGNGQGLVPGFRSISYPIPH